MISPQWCIHKNAKDAQEEYGLSDEDSDALGASISLRPVVGRLLIPLYPGSQKNQQIGFYEAEKWHSDQGLSLFHYYYYTAHSRTDIVATSAVQFLISGDLIIKSISTGQEIHENYMLERG